MRPLDESTAHAIDVIERNAKAQLRLIEDVLDVSRIIAGKMALSIGKVNIRDVLKATIDGVRPAASAKGVRLETRLDQDVACRADQHRLEQAFSNVLSNAVKFSRPGDLIAVSLHSADGWVGIRVPDTGVGIRREVLPFVFDRFRQADSSTTRRHGGLGLGLSIVRQIIELHDGTVSASSPGEGRGATFTLQLPLDRESGSSTPADSAKSGLPRPAGQSDALRGRRVLVVEDHDDARELVASVIGAAGAEVTSATTTEEALASLAETEPHLLVADLGLAGEDDYTLLKRIRALNTPSGRRAAGGRVDGVRPAVGSRPGAGGRLRALCDQAGRPRGAYLRPDVDPRNARLNRGRIVRPRLHLQRRIM